MHRLLCVLLTLLWASTALAVEGQAKRTYSAGQFTVYEYFLCDGDHSGDGDCAELNLATTAAGIPLFYTIDISVDASAAIKYAGLPVGRDTASGTNHTLPGAVSMGIAAVNTFTPTNNAMSHVIVLFDVTTAGTGAGNTDFEVLIRLWYLRS